MEKQKHLRHWQMLLIIASIVGFVYKWQIDCSVWGSAWCGNLPRLQQCIAQGGNPDASWQGISAMDGAFWQHHPACALFLLRHGADTHSLSPNIIPRIDPRVLPELVSQGLTIRGAWGDCALFAAVRSGQIDMVRALIRQGANPNAQDRQTNCSLWQAAHEPESLACVNASKISTLLIASGATQK